MLERLHYVFEGFRNETSHWQFLNSFFQPSVTRFFISWFALAPVFVRAIENLPDPLLIPLAGTSVSLSLRLPFSWEVLWWASLIYALAFVMYLIICPGFIKRYPSYNAYIDRGHSPRWLVWEVFRAWRSSSAKAKHKLLKRLVDKKYAIEKENNGAPHLPPTVSEVGTEWFFEYEQASYLLCINEELGETRQKDLFWEILARHGGSYAPARYFIWLLLLAASALVFWVVIQNIYFVLTFLL